MEINHLMTGDLVDGGIVTSTNPYLTTSSGSIVVGDKRIELKESQQIFVYLDNMHGFSCYRPAFVYNGNTLTGLCEFVLDKMPNLIHTEIKCFNRPSAHYHRKECGPVFSVEDTEAHLVLRPKIREPQ